MLDMYVTEEIFDRACRISVGVNGDLYLCKLEVNFELSIKAVTSQVWDASPVAKHYAIEPSIETDSGNPRFLLRNFPVSKRPLSQREEEAGSCRASML